MNIKELPADAFGDGPAVFYVIRKGGLCPTLVRDYSRKLGGDIITLMKLSSDGSLNWRPKGDEFEVNGSLSWDPNDRFSSYLIRPNLVDKIQGYVKATRSIIFDHCLDDEIATKDKSFSRLMMDSRRLRQSLFIIVDRPLRMRPGIDIQVDWLCLCDLPESLADQQRLFRVFEKPLITFEAFQGILAYGREHKVWIIIKTRVRDDWVFWLRPEGPA